MNSSHQAKLSTEEMDGLLYFKTEALKKKLITDMDDMYGQFIRPCPTMSIVEKLKKLGLIAHGFGNDIVLTVAGTDTVANMFPNPVEGDCHIELPVTFAKSIPALPLHMYIRFLEVIQLDLETLLTHLADTAFFNRNRAIAYGFVLNLGLAYSDQDCEGFLLALNYLHDNYLRLAKKDSNKEALLTHMTSCVGDLLGTLRADGHDE